MTNGNICFIIYCVDFCNQNIVKKSVCCCIVNDTKMSEYCMFDIIIM